MRAEWLDHCFKLSAEPATLYEGNRKIIRGRSLLWRRPRQDMTLADSGYTKSKMTMLRKYYLHEESQAVAIELWKLRLAKRKYGSVSFTTFNHFVKGGSVDSKRSRIASVFGPCIQSVALTWLPGDRTSVDVFYRTTELFKKFPADLVFLWVLLEPFDFSDAPIREIRFHFANITLHPMYFVTLLPFLEEPVAELEVIAESDPYFHTWIVKWSARYLLPEYFVGIAKYAQALRVKEDADKRIVGDNRDAICDYLRHQMKLKEKSK